MTDRRTFVVLASLIGSMTLASGVLLLLKPARMASSSRLLMLSAVAEQASNVDVQPLSTTVAVKPGRWLAIVVHDSGTASGSAKTIDEMHRRAGLGGLGYHFVIGNGHGSGDGEVETGQRWREQLDGAHSGGEHGQWYNEHAVGVCMIGDGDHAGPTSAQLEQLVKLVRELQAKLGVEADNVRIRFGSSADTDGGAFPEGWFRRQLLRVVR